MKRAFTSIAAVSVALGTLASAVSMASAASTTLTTAPNFNQRTITVGSYTIGVKGIVAKDSGQMTEFLPIYYLKAGLNKLGDSTTWNGTKQQFNITTPDKSTTNLTKVTPQTGDMTIFVNGVPVVNAPKTKVEKDPASGVPTSYLPIYYLSRALQQLGFTTAYDGTAGTWTVTPPKPPVTPPPVQLTLAITGAPTQVIAYDTQVNFTLTANGAPVTSGVTWSASGGVIDQNGNFVPSTGGTFTVTAQYNGQSTTATVTAYGPPAAVQLKAGNPSLIADGLTTDNIHVSVVDANGALVRNFSGTVALSTTHGSLAPASVMIQNGVGLARLSDQSDSSSTGTDTVSATGLQDSSGSAIGSNLTLGSLSITAVTPAATSLSLTPATATITTTYASTDFVTVHILDQAGHEMKSTGLYNMTFMLTGPGTFANGTTTTAAYIGDGNQVAVNSEYGAAGPITVTVGTPGLQFGSTTINATQTVAPRRQLEPIYVRRVRF